MAFFCSNRTCPLHPWEWPSKSWQRVHVDYSGPFQGTMFLIIMDAHMQWLEVISTQSTTSAKTIDILRSVITRNGLPEILVSDSGLQFTSEEFDQFTKTNGIKHLKSAPDHPATNGLADRFVQTFKQSLRAKKWEASSVERKLASLLMGYIKAPHATTNETPAKLFYGKNLRTRLDALKPDLRRDMAAKQMSQAIRPTGQHRELTVEQSVAVRNYREMGTGFTVQPCHVLVPCHFKSRQHLVSSGENTLNNFATPALQSRLRFRYRKSRLCCPVVNLRHPFSTDEEKRKTVMQHRKLLQHAWNRTLQCLRH